MIKDIRQLVYIPDYMAILCIYNDNIDLSVNELHRQYNISYSALHETKKLFIERGWVTLEIDGKKHIMNVTPLGTELVILIRSLIEKMGFNPEEIYTLKLGKKRRVIKNEIKVEQKENSAVEENSEATEEDSGFNQQSNNDAVGGEGNDNGITEEKNGELYNNGEQSNEEDAIPREIFDDEKGPT